MNENKCFLTDLDGTLLRSDASLSIYAKEVLTAAIEKGAVISYATARSYLSSSRAVSSIPWKAPIILYNGALIFDPIHQKVLDGQWLDREIANMIIELGRGYQLVPLLFSLDNEDNEQVLHEKLYKIGDVSFYNSRPNDPRFQEVEQLSCPETHRTLIITYIGLLEDLLALKKRISEEYGDQVLVHMMKDNYIKDHYFLEFSHPKANKAEGAKLWAELVGHSLSEISVFGDNLNDVGMFEAAGKSIAVANAHERLIELADQVISTNDEDAVARYISEQMTATNCN
ncbi:MAG: HAD-IIB family hydrolase [Candidatus Pristimantibacillus sp.]